MARLESVAVAGYYPTPASVVPLIAAALEGASSFTALDPCAGDGDAILSLVRELGGDKARLYAIEMEETRHHSLKDKAHAALGWGNADVLHSDAFRVTFKGDGVSLLYLNPPYDTDREHGRLEERFLARFTDALAPGGVLVFVVPFYALAASARTLATAYDYLSCYRFPDEEFAVYKQVVLVAKKRVVPLWEPDPTLFARVEAWSSDAVTAASFARVGPRAAIPSCSEWHRPLTWEARPLDLRGLLAAARPWSQTDRGGRISPVPGIVPEGALDDLLVRKYPLAMPPRPAHIAAGIAAGVFNGARIEPDDPASPLPALLVKGVFDKEFRTVDEKKDKEGNTKALVQIQQPKLVTTVLDLSTSRYVTIKPSAERTDARDVDGMTMADLLAHYGRGLMARMLAQCPVQHDPSRDGDPFPLPELARPLFQAQRHAVFGAVKLLGGPGKKQRRGRAAFVLGEIGSGKTSVALATSRAIEARRTLVLCPPHLLTSWKNQIEAVCPWVRAVVLENVADVAELAEDMTPGPVVAILSRETAKLGHAYEAVSRCGRCGAVPPEGDHAKMRSRCTATRILNHDPLGRLVRELAVDLTHVFPNDPGLRQLVSPRVTAGAGRWAGSRTPEARRTRLILRGTRDRLLAELVDRVLTRAEGRKAWLDAIGAMLWADPVREVVLEVARLLLPIADSACARTARTLLLAFPDVDLSEFRALEGKKESWYGDPWREFETHRTYVHTGEGHSSWSFSDVRRTDEGRIELVGVPLGDWRGLVEATLHLAKLVLRQSKPCGAPLYQAIPEPRRFPLATFIAKRHPRLFDLLVLDEGHEYATDGSAQEQAAHRLTGLGIPTLLLTGTVMNGYASSLFTNMWALSSAFRREFARDEQTRFVDRYGYRKRIVEDRDRDTKKVVEYGSMSDRVERSERMIGDAPGVLPVFLLRYLLPMAVTLHKTDLAIDIPRCTETTENVEPDAELVQNFERLKKALLARIKADRFDPDLSGKLWGALAELPGYLDCATEDVGNGGDEGRYEIRYPESVGGRIVEAVDLLPASTILPKEAWLLEFLEAAFKADRNVLVFAWHTKLLARIARLVARETGETCPILVPEKVPTKKREDWINAQVVSPRRRVLVCNPLTVQTGLNNLVHFADQVWLENPACNPVVYRQAVGRVDRIGQTKETRIAFPLYQGTAQQALHSLLLQKVGVSMSTDGLDGESAMQAAGVGETGFSSFSVGRQLYEMIRERD